MFFKLRILVNLLELKLVKKRYRSNIKGLQAYRWKKFQSTLASSPFYADLARQHAPLEKYPVMNKQLFMEHFDLINTQGIKKDQAFETAIQAELSRDFSPMIENITVGLSSGTSGNRGIFLVSQKERAQWVAYVLDRVIPFSLKKRSVAFFLRANSNLYDSVKSKVLKFEFFDLLDEQSVHIPRLNSLQPSVLVAQPSMLLDLAKEMEKGLLVIHPEKIISVAEVLYPEDKAYLERVFGQHIHQVYQCTEGFLASTCTEGVLHFHEDFLIIEKKYLDETKTRFHPIITDLKRLSQPIVRYELNDIIHELNDCPCGQKTMAIAKIEGRSDDVLLFKNSHGIPVKIYPDFFRRAIILSDESIHDYLLVQRSSTLMELYVNGNQELFEKAKNGVKNLLQQHAIEGVEITKLDIPPHKKGDKLRRIRYESNETN
jgi:putative adenylate-forming enzyme